MISLQLIRKILLSLFPFLIFYLLKSRNEKKKERAPLNVDKDKIEEGEIIEKKD